VKSYAKGRRKGKQKGEAEGEVRKRKRKRKAKLRRRKRGLWWRKAMGRKRPYNCWIVPAKVDHP
jgi:hypothetical protein